MFLHFDPSLARALWDAANTPNLSSQDKGTLLEVLIAYLLSTQGHFEVIHNVRTVDAQIDLLVRNLTVDNLVFREFGTYMLAECKYWNRPVTAAVVKKFIADLRSASCRSGILVSLHGITGVGTNRDALYSIRKHYHRDNVVVTIINRQDIEDVLDQKVGLPELLIERYESIR